MPRSGRVFSFEAAAQSHFAKQNGSVLLPQKGSLFRTYKNGNFYRFGMF